MASTFVVSPPISRIPTEIFHAILESLLFSIVPDFTSTSVLCNLYRGPWVSRATVVLRTFYLLRGVSPQWNNSIINFAPLWSFLALQQMDEDSVKRAVERSGGYPLTVIVTRSSVGRFISVMLLASQRIQTLYIDIRDEAWEALSPVFGMHNFDQLRYVYLSNATKDATSQRILIPGWGGGLVVGGGGGWGNAGGGMGGWGDGHGWATTAPVMAPTSTLVGYERAIARLQHIPGSTLCLRYSSFAFYYFTPPSQLARLHIQDLALHLAHFDNAVRASPNLTEIELWEVNVVPSTMVQPVVHPGIRYLAVKGSAATIHTLTLHLRLCNIAVEVFELCDYTGAADLIISTHIHEAFEVFVLANVVTSVGIFADIQGQHGWNHTIDLVLYSSQPQATTMSMRLPLRHMPIIGTLLSTFVTPTTRISFDVAHGVDHGHTVRDLFENNIPTSIASVYHVRIEEQHVDAVITAMEAATREPSTTEVVFHGSKRAAALGRVRASYGVWAQSVRLADERHCDQQHRTEPGTWMSMDHRRLFSPSVYGVQDHLMRMLAY